jgi:hypothetical protein
MEPQKKKSSDDRSEDCSGQSVSPLCHIQLPAAAHPETFSHPNYNGVLPHPAGRLNSQESPSAGVITTVPAWVGVSC